MKTAVLGSGSWGCALANILAENGNDVCLWSFFKEESEELSKYHENKKNLPGLILSERISYTSNIKTAVEGKELIVLVTPSSVIGDTAKSIAPFVSDGAIIVCASKGFDGETQKTLTETIESYIKNAKIAALSGPSHAEEVARKMPTTLVSASCSLEVAKKVQSLFSTKYLRVYTSSDVLGVEIGGALKNIIALCAGISDGLGFGDNAKAAIITRGMNEIARLGTALGADLSTFSGLTGMGDLIVTCTSMHSRNRRAGILLGQGKTKDEAMSEVNMVVEGVFATREAYKLSKRLNIEMPITEEAYKVLFEGKSAKNAAIDLMKREQRHEADSGFVSKC